MAGDGQTQSNIDRGTDKNGKTRQVVTSTMWPLPSSGRKPRQPQQQRQAGD